MEIIVLAGGFGTRLKSVLPGTPKALAQVGKVPFLALQLENWVAQGGRSFTFLLHHQADQIITFLETMRSSLLKGCQIKILVEPTPMDTGGAIAYAVQELGLDEDFLVANADTWLGSGICELELSSSPTIAVVHLDDVSRYGQVKLDHENRITSFQEKNTGGVSGWVNAGLCRLRADFFRNWDGSRFSLEKQTFPKFVERGELSAVIINADFIDIGIPEDYQRFCSWIATGRKGAL